MSETVIEINIHDFKTNLSQYVRLLEENPKTVIIVKRYNETVGIFMPYNN